jgi:hypothetical protein
MEVGDIIKFDGKNWIIECIVPVDDEKSMLVFSETNLIALPIRSEQEDNRAFQEEGSHFVSIGGVKYPVELDELLKPGEWYIRRKGK